MTMASYPPRRPQFDPELRASLAVVGGVFPPTVTPELMDFMRQSYASPPIEQTLHGRLIDRAEHTYAGYLGEDRPISVLRPREAQGPRPAVLFVHSGGLMFGDRFSGIDLLLDWVDRLGVVIVTMEYRLAPEFPDPYPREDVYAALEWMSASAADIGVRRDRMIVAGASAGGGLAAGVALAARDRGGPALRGQVLDYPMLDDRGLTASTYQFDGVGVWDRISNETGWDALLGKNRGGPNISPYAAPARAEDLSGLPPAFLDVGAAEIFRDETIAFADGIWRCGGNAELHVWGGGFHAFDIFAAHTALARGMIQTRDAWVERVLAD